MSRDRDDAWDSYSGDTFDSVNRDNWDEDDWEAFLIYQDALDAKYQELYETLRDHPDRDELIAREMHWHLPDDLCAGGDAFPDETDEDNLEDDQAPDDEAAFADTLESIAAYRQAREYAMAVDRQLTARLRDRLARDMDAACAMRAALDVGGQVASGHGIGYDRDALCGNIACCKRAIKSLAECFDSLLALRRRGILSPAQAHELLDSGREAGHAVARRVEELRRHVWWR